MSSNYQNAKPVAAAVDPVVAGASVARLWPVWVVVASIGASLMWGVFSMYTSPEFIVDMANQLWSCF